MPHLVTVGRAELGLRPLLMLALLLCAIRGVALEPPPAPGAQLEFRKTLFVQQDGSAKVFAESHQVVPGDTVWQLLTEQYGIAPEAVPTFLDAFRRVNPEVDPDRLRPGTVVRVPFKVEETLTVPDVETLEHVVRPGESLWRILQRDFGLTREEMGQALRSIATANPAIEDLNRLYVGQRISIPDDVAGKAAAAPSLAGGALSDARRTVLELLSTMGCTVAEDGETFLPLARGQTLRLEAKDFPLVTGPNGDVVILDPRGRLAPALVRGIEQSWAYRVVQGVDSDPEAQLGRLLPLLGFHEVGEGLRTVAAGPGVSIKALPRWTVLPRPEDLWEGQIHLLFSAGAVLHPALVKQVRRVGFRVHRLGGSGETEPEAKELPLVRLPMADPAAGAGQLLGLLGVPYRTHPEVECRLGNGVSYRLRPLLVFRYLGLDYAVPPPEPDAAESILSRAGYITLPWREGASALNLLADLLALVGVPHARTTIELPAHGALRMQVSGIVLESPQIAGFLYPSAGADEPTSRVFLTDARIDDTVTELFATQGLLPWVVELR